MCNEQAKRKVDNREKEDRAQVIDELAAFV